MRTHHLPLAIAVATSLLASAAHAQSSYAMTTLSTPASSFGFAATAMDNSGRVAGFVQYRDGTAYPVAGDLGSYNCIFGCATYSVRMVYWPAGTATSASATNGISHFLASTLNDRGDMFGLGTTPKRLKFTLTTPVTPIGLDGYAPQLPSTEYPTAVVNGVIPSSASRYEFVTYGINQNSVVYGHSYRRVPVGTTGEYDVELLPATQQGSTVTATPVPALYFAGMYTAMNSTGGAAGVVISSDGGLESTRWPAMWLGGNLSLINLPNTYQAAAMNNAGQVLMQEPSTSAKAAIWFNGAATHINGNGKRVLASAMNSSGTVVGCTQNNVTSPTRADNTAFIWKNGVLQDLSQVLTSKGVKLPSGTRLGCPIAINDSGSILAYYYRTASVNTVTWVRFTARP
jgi:hypothetical protein